MPDFDNFTKALLCQSEPERVPQFDGTVAADIKARFLGKPVQGIEEEVEFCMAAGYDYVPLTIGFRQTIRGEKQGIMGSAEVHTTLLKPAEAQHDPTQNGKITRMWAEEGEGVIRDQASFDDFDWPDPDRSYSFDTLEKLSTLLPDGAKAIVNVGYRRASRPAWTSSSSSASTPAGSA
jgi:hypothetical protein